MKASVRKQGLIWVHKQLWGPWPSACSLMASQSFLGIHTPLEASVRRWTGDIQVYSWGAGGLASSIYVGLEVTHGDQVCHLALCSWGGLGCLQVHSQGSGHWWGKELEGLQLVTSVNVSTCGVKTGEVICRIHRNEC